MGHASQGTGSRNKDRVAPDFYDLGFDVVMVRDDGQEMPLTIHAADLVAAQHRVAAMVGFKAAGHEIVAARLTSEVGR